MPSRGCTAWSGRRTTTPFSLSALSSTRAALRRSTTSAPGARADGRQIALQELVVERPGHGPHVLHERHQRQPGHLPPAVVRADEHDAVAAGDGFSRISALTNGHCAAISSSGSVCMRMYPAPRGRSGASSRRAMRRSSRCRSFGKGAPQIAHGQPVAPAQDVRAPECRGARPSARRARRSRSGTSARDGAVQQRIRRAAAARFCLRRLIGRSSRALAIALEHCRRSMTISAAIGDDVTGRRSSPRPFRL